MTIRSIIQRADEIRENQISDQLKFKWLSELDMQIYEDIILTHEGAEDYSREFPYADDNAELIAPPRFATMYESFLCSKIDYMQNEMSRYSNDSTIFNNEYQAFANYYNEKHRSANNFRIHTKPNYARSSKDVYPFG